MLSYSDIPSRAPEPRSRLFDQHKLVLASTKDHAHRIYLSRGIFAEVTLHYQHRGWRHHEWTFPNYPWRGLPGVLHARPRATAPPRAAGAADVTWLLVGAVLPSLVVSCLAAFWIRRRARLGVGRPARPAQSWRRRRRHWAAALPSGWASSCRWRWGKRLFGCSNRRPGFLRRCLCPRLSHKTWAAWPNKPQAMAAGRGRHRADVPRPPRRPQGPFLASPHRRRVRRGRGLCLLREEPATDLFMNMPCSPACSASCGLWASSTPLTCSTTWTAFPAESPPSRPRCSPPCCSLTPIRHRIDHSSSWRASCWCSWGPSWASSGTIKPPAKIFMGDSGAYFIGFCIAVATLLATFTGSGLPRHAILAPLCVLAVPLYDTITVV